MTHFLTGIYFGPGSNPGNRMKVRTPQPGKSHPFKLLQETK